MTTDSTAAPEGTRATAGAELVAWLLIAAAMLAVYARTFSAFPVIERKVSVVGEADAASYIRLWRGFRLDQPIGNAYAIEGRTLDDVAEKHRLHHPVSAATGYVLTRASTALYRGLGLPEREAPFAISALWGAVNIILVGLLLRRWNASGNPVWPFLVLYGVSLSPWLYSAVPDSWTLTTSLFLVYLLLVASPRIPAAAVAMALGVFMVNNMALGPAILFLCLARWREPPRLGEFLRRAILLSGIAIATWAGCLTILSLVEPGYRLDRLMAYSAWFRQFIGASLPPWDPYVWKSILTNLFVSSLVSNQPDPNMPQEALLYTLQRSWLGRIAVAGVVVMFSAAAFRALGARRQPPERGGPEAEPVRYPVMAPLLFCLVMVVVTYALYYPSGFTYAAWVLPMQLLLLHRFLDFRRPADRIIALAGITLVVVNNVAQIFTFRATLAALG